MDMVLNAWQCAFLGAVGGLLFAAVFWFLFGKSTDIFFNAEYKSGLIGSIVLGVIYALALYHCFNSCLWLIPSGLSILFWNLAVLYDQSVGRKHKASDHAADSPSKKYYLPRCHNGFRLQRADEKKYFLF